jgi:Alpha/beta hydrolase of unknown function (DUF900)
MTPFLDVRVSSSGGPLANTVSFYQGSSIGDYQSITRQQLLATLRGRNVLIGTHGFNVNRGDGVYCLDTWGKLLLQFDPRFDVFLGLVWPGDSVWAHGLDYPDEPKVADDAGELLGPFLDQLMSGSASVSFASHSLGARVVLHTVMRMNSPVRRVILMAGAINDDCLANEFQSAAAKIGEISILASESDEILALAFPLGNLLSGILDAGHPWWQGALGRSGPQQSWPQNFRGPFLIPSDWNYGHLDYLRVAPSAAGAVAQHVDVPSSGTPMPTNGGPGWRQTFSAGFAGTRFKG